jgi:hypothetical protein
MDPLEFFIWLLTFSILYVTIPDVDSELAETCRDTKSKQSYKKF